MVKPLVALAPLDGVTDPVFRGVVHSLAPADLYSTEFVKAEHVTEDFLSREREAARTMPTVVQLWGNDPDAYEAAAARVGRGPFVGIDINLGCAVPKILRKGYCAALMERPALVRELVAAVRRGAPELPVSVKTRLADNDAATDRWLGFLTDLEIDAAALHFRRMNRDYRSAADWSGAAGWAARFHAAGKRLFGNGDVLTRPEARRVAGRYGLDGVMIGRAVLRNPCAFAEDPTTSFVAVAADQRIVLFRRHLAEVERLYGPEAFPRMKRYVATYLFDLPEAAKGVYGAPNFADARGVLSRGLPPGRRSAGALGGGRSAEGGAEWPCFLTEGRSSFRHYEKEHQTR